ncbi:MAG: bifunctional folylpolyglutamate synthase/dihydrofolate synthase [Micrococcales bacterium]|nr:bifunctional folylpolyglutamate synthase/dihydrofolate synthase [Micrococcales bacterium]
MSQEARDEKYWASQSDIVLEKLLLRIPENKIRPRLEPTRRAVELLGDPQRSYRVIHVTGTNGKTSTTRFIERILREHGLRTGRFTSPHLVRINERMALDGEPVSDEQLISVYSDIEPILEFVDQELADSGENPLTFFEALAVLGFAVFADAPVDVLVLEVGMGGAWDSTNVADGDVAVFTPIGLDHMDRLGNTLEEIADTKSGIIKPGSLVVSSAQERGVLAVLENAAKQKAEAFKLEGRDFEVSEFLPSSTGQSISISGLAGSYGPYQAPVFGSHQGQNLAVAVAAVEAFLGGGQIQIADDILRSAISDVSSPGRLQLIRTVPNLLLDGAHNPAGALILAQALRAEFSEKPLAGVIAVLAEKDAAGLFSNLAGVFESLVITQSSSPRSMPVAELESIAKDGLGQEVESISGFRLALERAKQRALEIDGTVVVTGSITLVGDVIKLIQEESDEE